jgi:hypothetical protein
MHETKFWTSYSQYDGLGSVEAGFLFMISVVLDAGAWKHFSSIGLALVYRETAELQNVVSSVLFLKPFAISFYLNVHA